MKLPEDTLIVSDKRGRKMKYKLFEEIVLNKDIPEKNLKKGDVATIVEHHPIADGEDGYSLEIFNVFGDTIAVTTVPESAIEPLTEDEVFNVRPLVAA
jgi:hypothetical protein